MKTKKKVKKEASPSWRPCPLGQYWVSAHPKKKMSSRGLAYVQKVGGHCRKNRSHLDRLSRAEILEISRKKFSASVREPDVASAIFL